MRLKNWERQREKDERVEERRTERNKERHTEREIDGDAERKKSRVGGGGRKRVRQTFKEKEQKR